jgi:hypothetical protein
VINPVLKTLFLIDKLLVNSQIVNPVFIDAVYKWKPGFQKIHETYTFEKNGKEIGEAVRNLAGRVLEDLEAAINPPEYEEEEVEEYEEDIEQPGANEVPEVRPVPGQFDRAPSWENGIADAFADVPQAPAAAPKKKKKKVIKKKVRTPPLIIPLTR